ncbi:GspH/FimT family pseudopilin [Noviherbaspirillum galbum]|uniref:Type II secretion system protein H n=1 Tax=Noviherbaspirillum galbum TaxID=2709383 RepID=A0A6B3SZC6_9BURK|nr:GspH/FimT family pseudopilin [Noviherbaspirillum galbum]NEX64582.1 prepilin-type N-terminal cleavage/methylation domain-containing protein [Noviherbaspirillum galbum]
MKAFFSPASQFSKGFSLIELLVVIAIVGITAGLAVPSFRGAVEKYRLKGAAEAMLADFQFARITALRSNQTVYMNFSTGSNWCYGMKVASTCTCGTSGDCSLKAVASSAYKEVTLNASTFSADPGFDPVRGTSTEAGNIVLQSTSGMKVQINLSLIGKVGICTPAASNGVGYPTC